MEFLIEKIRLLKQKYVYTFYMVMKCPLIKALKDINSEAVVESTKQGTYTQWILKNIDI